MICMDECEYSECDLDEIGMRFIADLCGPWTVTMLMLPGPVPVVWERDPDVV